MPGPLPETTRRRRNAPQISGHLLPAEGRRGAPPKVPDAYELAEAGLAWWKWAWRLPQATKWDRGSLYLVARRAQLEDELAALGFGEELGLLDELLRGAEPEAIQKVTWALERLKRSASGMTGLMKEQRELDDRLGLNPKAMAALRWTVAESAESAETPADVPNLAAYRDRGR